MITPDSATDEERRRGLRRMRTLAVALLLFAAVVYVATAGRDGWWGYVSAGAEASMVGAIADWFAVTALFKHPLGVPIPHTALIPKRKDDLGRGLEEFVGENFLHMHVEESALNSALWAAYSDAELLEIHQRILASIDPAEMALVLRWMVPAMSPGERAAMLGEMQTQMPPEAMRWALEIVRPHLDDSAWRKLARALRIPPAPGW